MLYVGPVFDPRPFTRRPPFSRRSEAAHLSADTIAELRAYLERLGFPRSYFHRPGSPNFHYDLYGRYLAAVLTDPRVRRVSRRKYIDKLQAKRLLAHRLRRLRGVANLPRLSGRGRAELLRLKQTGIQKNGAIRVVLRAYMSDHALLEKICFADSPYSGGPGTWYVGRWRPRGRWGIRKKITLEHLKDTRLRASWEVVR